MKWILIIIFFTPNFVVANINGIRITPDHYVYDEASILNEKEKQELNKKLNSIRSSGLKHIYIYLTNEIESQSEDSSLALFFHSLNQVENNILIHVNVREADYDILVTKGLKDRFPEWVVESIEDKSLKANFKSEKYFLGLSDAIENIVGVSNGSINLEDLKKDSSGYPIVVLFLVILFFILIFPILQFFAMKKAHFSTKSIDFVSKILLMNSFGTRGKNVFDSFSRGTGKFNSKDKDEVKQKGGGGTEGLW
jgi:uncharacterized membrane protein YgcG